MDILLLTRQILLDSFYEVSARVVKNRGTWKTIVFLGLLMQTVRLSAQTISDLQSQIIWTQPADHPNGQQHFITTDQWCCRYAVLKIDSGEIEINRLAFVNRRYPYQRLGSFTCNDSFFNDLWEMSVHTIETVSDDAYGTDARERNEWIQDGHKASFSVSSVALSAPAFKGKTDVALLKSMLRHAALTQLEDGILLATFPTDRGPSDCHYIIEDYASQWIEVYIIIIASRKIWTL